VFVCARSSVCLHLSLRAWMPGTDEAGAEMALFDDDNLAKKSVFFGMCVYEILLASHAQAPNK
jgi:hypothetical protein